MKPLVPVDYSAMKVNQGFVILLGILAFVFNQPWLSGALGLFMLVSSIALKRPAFGFVYTRWFKPAGWVKPEVIQDHKEPHLFAQGVGGTFLVTAAVALFAGAAVLGWALDWIVVALAALNVFGGFCVGCAMYYWLNRLNVPGFVQTPPSGTFPGLKPKGAK
jgi:hypothetical protein